MTQIKETFESKDAQYQVDPSKWAELVNALSLYLFDERIKYERNGGETGRFPTYFAGKGRCLAILTEVGIPVGGMEFVGSHNLATLVGNEDGNMLSFNVHAYTGLDVDPTKLYRIGEFFCTNSKSNDSQ
jgi:hypothetical protein